MELLQRLDQQVVHREPDRAPPVRVAAEDPGGGLGRLVVHAVLDAVDRQHVGMVAVVARERADAVGREELVAIQHVGEHADELRPPHDRQQPAHAAAGADGGGDVAAELRPVVDEPLHAPLEAGQPVEHVRLQRLDGEQRDEPDHRAHLEQARVVGQVQDVVVEAVLLVPQRDAVAQLVHGVGDVDEVLEELRGDVLVGRVVLASSSAMASMFRQYMAIHDGAVGLLEVAAARQRRGAVEHADVVQAEEAALEDVLALGVLAVHPPGEVQQQLVEGALEEQPVGHAGHAAIDLVDAPHRPGVDRRVDVAEGPLVGRDLPVGVHVPLAQEQDQLGLGELGVDHGQRDHVERQVPGGVPRVLPLVGHRDDVLVVEVRPLVIAPDLARRGRRAARPDRRRASA